MTEGHGKSNFEQGVMVDVGPGFGALVIYTRDELVGSEIEITPRGEDFRGMHTQVLRRKTSLGNVFAAVFGSLPEGDYRLRQSTLSKPLDVQVVSNQVTELDWR